MKNFRSALIGLIATAILAGPAAAENVLRFTIGIGGAVTMDPHSRWNAIERPALQQVYETLLDIDSNLAIVPQLALAWKPLDPTTWEFELRPAVTFHDGTPFTAEDVAVQHRAGACRYVLGQSFRQQHCRRVGRR